MKELEYNRSQKFQSNYSDNSLTTDHNLCFKINCLSILHDHHKRSSFEKEHIDSMN